MWSQWATWPRGQCVCQTKIYILNEGFPHKWVKTTNLTLLNDFLYFISPENFQGWKTTNTVTPTAKLTVLLMQWSSVWGHISQFDVFDLEGKCIVGKFSAWSLCVNLIPGWSPGWDFQSYVETACDLVHWCINMVFLVVVSCGRKSAWVLWKVTSGSGYRVIRSLFPKNPSGHMISVGYIKAAFLWGQQLSANQTSSARYDSSLSIRDLHPS